MKVGSVFAYNRSDDIRRCNFGVWYRDFDAVNGFDETFQRLGARARRTGARRNGRGGTF
jgi:hypothetical protein